VNWRRWPVPPYSHATWGEWCDDVNRGNKGGLRPPEPGSIEECRALDPELTAQVERLVEARLGREIADLRHQLEARKTTQIRIPRLKSSNIQAFIGAVSRAVQNGQITAGAGNSLLYAAQMMLGASKTHPSPTAGMGSKVARLAGNVVRGVIDG
jgi:hypothetical protein